ncbi:MAG: L-rhamnose mutarotase [Caldilineaceae bacterium]|nr:L-rhamnose mutarotase [Caldilineaceae bacterium]
MERVAFAMHVREGEEEEYRRRHQDVWPAVLADLERAGVRSMSIFMAERQLFLYMETENYAEAVRILAQSPESVRWEEYMAPIMEDESGDDYDPHDAYPEGMPEVFHWQIDGRGEGRDTVSKGIKT